MKRLSLLLLPRWQMVDPNVAHGVDRQQGHETGGGIRNCSS